MSLLYDRVCALQIGGEIFSYTGGVGLRTSFDILKSNKAAANAAKFQVYNLRPEHRALAQKKGTPVVFEAGYDSINGLVFSGEVRFSSSQRQGPDWITTIEAGDGVSSMLQPVSFSISEGTDVVDAVKEIARKSGLDIGNLDAILGVKPGEKVTKNGMTGIGRAKELIKRLVELWGLTFSVQEGQIQILAKEPQTDPAAATNGTVVVLDSNTGMLGVPELLETPESETVWATATSLLNPSIKPGALVTVLSENLKGNFRAENCRYTGDTHGPKWEVQMEGQQL